MPRPTQDELDEIVSDHLRREVFAVIDQKRARRQRGRDGLPAEDRLIDLEIGNEELHDEQGKTRAEIALLRAENARLRDTIAAVVEALHAIMDTRTEGTTSGHR